MRVWLGDDSRNAEWMMSQALSRLCSRSVGTCVDDILGVKVRVVMQAAVSRCAVGEIDSEHALAKEDGGYGVACQ